MPQFRYKAVKEPGGVVEGRAEAADRKALIAMLHAQGYLPIRAEPVGSGSVGSWVQRELTAARRPSRRDVAATIRELAMLLRAGLTLDQALDILIEFTDKASVRVFLRDVVEKVRGGASFSESLSAQANVFGRFSIGMVRAGEVGGALETVLARTADYLDRTETARRQIRSALAYPTILLLTSFLSVAVVVIVVIPSFQDIFAQAGYELPLITQVVLSVGETAKAFWWLPLIGAAIATLAFLRARRIPESRRAMDRWLLRVPVLGSLSAKSEVSRLTYTLGTLLSNGVPFLNALAIAKETVGNSAMAAAIGEFGDRVKEGKSFAALMENSGLFPRLATRLVRIGEESGRLEDMLFHVAETYDQDLQISMQRLLGLLVPFVTLVAALVVGLIILAVLVPMLSIPDMAF